LKGNAVRYLIRLLPFVLLVVLFVSVDSALAVVTCAEYDFTVSDGGFDVSVTQNDLGVYTPTVGFTSTLENISNRQYIEIVGPYEEIGPVINIYFEYTTNVNTGYDHHYNPGPTQIDSDVLFCGGACTLDLTVDSVTADTWIFRFWGPNDASGSIALTYIRFDCEGEPPEAWIRPFSLDDEDAEWEIWDYNLVMTIDSDYFGEMAVPFDADDIIDYAYGIGFPHLGVPADPQYFNHLLTPPLSTVIASSNDIGDSVLAATGGTVASITKLTENNCADLLIPINPNTSLCQFKIPPAIGETPTPTQEFLYDIDLTNSYIVMIDIGELGSTGQPLFLEYIVDNPRVQVGDTILAGCILGESIELLAVSVMTITSHGSGLSVGLSYPFGVSASISENSGETYVSQPTSKGVTFVTLKEEIFPTVFVPEYLLGNLTIYSTPLEACNVDPAYRSCAGDPQLRHPEDWQVSNNEVQWLNPGAILFPVARISMQLELVETNAYSLNVEAETLGDDGANPEITIQLGSEVASSTITVGIGIPQFFFIAADIREPDIGTFYTVAIHNTGDVPIRINAACVTEGDPTLAPNTCYFFNPSFDLGGSGWTASGGVGFNSEFGIARLDTGETIAQFVHLFPEDEVTPHLYRFTVETGLWTEPSYVIDEADETSTVELDFDWPDGTGFVGMEDVADGATAVTFRKYALGHNAVTFEAYLNVTTETQGDLVIEPTITTADTEVLGLTIRSMCIYGPYPNQLPEQGYNPPFRESCTRVTAPDSELLSEWISYHWKNLDNFFQCQLMALLNRMYKLAVDTYRLIGWLGRWTHSLITYDTNWFSNQFLPWLNGHFRNMTGGTIVTIEGGGASFWDVLLALINQVLSPIINLIVGLVNMAASLVLTIVTAVISLVVNVITMILSLFGLLIALLSSIITSYHVATPATIPGAPNCTDPQSSGFCVANWILENTIFSGPGAAIIPVVIAIGSILFILWAISTIKQAVTEAVQVS
jgi:hypothetical protein